MTREEVVKKYPKGSKFKVISTGDVKVVGGYGTGIRGVLIKENYEDYTGFNTYEIEPVSKFKVGDTVIANEGSMKWFKDGYTNTIKQIKGDFIHFEDGDCPGWNQSYFTLVEKKGLRMYFFVMYNLSGIQKGIQAGHAAIEYGMDHNNEVYKDFAENHKTFILLDGGGSNDMRQRALELELLAIPHSKFFEPDLNNSLSAIAFIVPECIYGASDGDYNESSYQEKYRQYLKGFRLASN